MKKAVISFLVGFCILMGSVVYVHATLIDWGINSEYFKDTDAGFFWYDPNEFAGWSLIAIDVFVTSSSIWEWATPMEVFSLLFKETSGVALEQVIGPSSYTWTSPINGKETMEWLGFYSPASPNAGVGVGSEENVSPLFNKITSLSYVSDIGSYTSRPGAWLRSNSDPTVPAPATLILLGSGLIAFAGFRRKFGK
ncbi:MAG: PEP-CTERM sorting domain-containing protein [Deltaproteobacteria bacterium]|nr:PEP-CTERM sorting domain-containing protein [Deltaproteobacteria bacterium]